MSTADTKTDSLRAIAAEAVTAFARAGRQIQPFSPRYPAFTMDNAYGVTALANEMRVAKGKKPVGRKVGFTNRQLWTEYGVHAPNWGYMYDGTVHVLSSPSPLWGEGRGEGDRAAQSVAAVTPSPAALRAATSSLIGRGQESVPVVAFAEPKIEPEIMFGLAQAPSPGMDDAALLACIAWVAHGFEIVQSIFPHWTFSAADSVAANAMHGALLMGPRHAIGPQRPDWLRTLPAFDVELYCNGKLMERGTGASVLEGPLSVLRHLADLLARDRDNPPLAAGEIISTGTLTRALPVKPGETWTTKLAGIALEDASLRFV